MSKKETKINKYLIPKKGADGSDLTETRFVVSTSSIENTNSKSMHKPFGLDNKLELDLINKLKHLNAWKGNLYNKDEVYGVYLRGKGFKRFAKEYKEQLHVILNPKNLFEPNFEMKKAIPQGIRNDGVENIKKLRGGQ